MSVRGTQGELIVEGVPLQKDDVVEVRTLNSGADVFMHLGCTRSSAGETRS